MAENREEEMSCSSIEWKIENVTFIDSESIRAEWTSSFKDLYEKERNRILGKLPEAYKMRFRTIGFYESKPVMIVSPYDVPPGEIRRLWMEAFFNLVYLIDKKKPKKFLKKMPQLIHDFQCLQAGPEYSVSLVVGTETILTFEQGAALDLDSVPKEIQRKTMNKINPSPLTEQERVKFRGLENMFPFVDTKNILPWIEPPKDCDAFQFIEKLPVMMIPPSETVSPRADRTFGTTVMLRGPGLGDDDRYPAKIIKYHGDFTLVEYPNRQRQWLPLQNQDIEFVAVNHVGKVVSCVKEPCIRSVSVEDDQEEENDGKIQRIVMDEALLTPATLDPIVIPSETSAKNVTSQTSLDIDETVPTVPTPKENDKITHAKLIETVALSPRREARVSEKRCASPIQRNSKSRKLDSTSVPTAPDPFQQVSRREQQKIDENGDNRPSNQAKPAMKSGEKSEISDDRRPVDKSEQGTRRNAFSPAPTSRDSRSKVKDQTQSRNGSVAYGDMTIAALAEHVNLRNCDITSAALDEIFRRPWDGDYISTKICPTITRLQRSHNLKLSSRAEKVVLAWNIDHYVKDLCDGSYRESCQMIYRALDELVSLSENVSYKAALGHCNRLETLESGIVSANEYLRRVKKSPIEEKVRVRLTGRVLVETGNEYKCCL